MNPDHAFEYQQLIIKCQESKRFFFLNQIERILILIIKNPENEKLNLSVINHSINSGEQFFIYVVATY